MTTPLPPCADCSAPLPPCAYCRHLPVMHIDGKGSCTWPHCSCCQFTDPARLAASIARHPAGKALK